MSDIVKRLHEMAEADYYGRDQPHFVPPEECADEIGRLRAALVESEDIRRSSAANYAKRLGELREERHICEDSRLDLLRHLTATTEERDALRKALVAASHALRSYQYGNSSTELAESIADACDAALEAKP